MQLGRPLPSTLFFNTWVASQEAPLMSWQDIMPLANLIVRREDDPPHDQFEFQLTLPHRMALNVVHLL